MKIRDTYELDVTYEELVRTFIASIKVPKGKKYKGCTVINAPDGRPRPGADAGFTLVFEADVEKTVR